MSASADEGRRAQATLTPLTSIERPNGMRLRAGGEILGFVGARTTTARSG